MRRYIVQRDRSKQAPQNHGERKDIRFLVVKAHSPSFRCCFYDVVQCLVCEWEQLQHNQYLCRTLAKRGTKLLRFFGYHALILRIEFSSKIFHRKNILPKSILPKNISQKKYFANSLLFVKKYFSILFRNYVSLKKSIYLLR